MSSLMELTTFIAMALDKHTTFKKGRAGWNILSILTAIKHKTRSSGNAEMIASQREFKNEVTILSKNRNVNISGQRVYRIKKWPQKKFGIGTTNYALPKKLGT